MAVCFRWCLGLRSLRWSWWRPSWLAGGRGCIGHVSAGGQYDPGWCGADSWRRKPRRPGQHSTITGKQNAYFSSLDNVVAQGDVLPVLYG